MAQTTQIVPKFQHAHVMTVINDYSGYTDETPVVSDDSVKFINVFMGPRGIDNKLVKVTQSDNFKTIFGESDFAKYGQPLMMPIAELSSGNASAWCMRVLPDDATLANSILSIYYKADVAKKKFRIKFKTKSLTGGDAPKSKDELILKGLQLDGEAGDSDEYKDAEGYTQVPIMVVCPMGRGNYGNDQRWRISSNIDWEIDYKMKIFSFETLEPISGIQKTSTAIGSAITTTRYSDTTLIQDVIDDQDPGTAATYFYTYEDQFEKLYDAYCEFLDDVAKANPNDVIEKPDLDEFDPFFGRTIGSTTLDPYIKIVQQREAGVLTLAVDDPADYTDDTVALIDGVEGNILDGGSDGILDTAEDQDTLDAAIEKMYNDAFSGVLDKTILSKKRVPCNALLDANYPLSVKKTMMALNEARGDAMLYLDTGILSSLSDPVLRQLKVDYAVFNTMRVSKNCQHYKVKDPSTNKKVDVTVTYYLAQKLASHIKTYGTQQPFANLYAVLSGHIKNSLLPAVEEYEQDLKDQLVDLRLNYFEAVGENEFRRMSQNTSQSESTDLLEESNVLTLLEAKRMIEDDTFDNIYNFSDPDAREAFKNYETSRFESWKGSRVQDISVDFQMNAWEEQRSTLHCYLSMKFRTITKRVIVEVDINNRTSE